MTMTLQFPASRATAPCQAASATAANSEAGRGAGTVADASVGTTLLSFVIPVKEEEHTLTELRRRIAANVPDTCDYEVIFVDDGSCDASWGVIAELSRLHPTHVRGIRFRHNVGKAAALTAGFRAARGEIIFTLDADLQDDPQEIPNFLARLAEGYGLVSGWKKTRHDPWHKVLPSRVFNWMLSRVTGVELHDHNCGFKCYRRDLATELTLHGELHRMVPSLSAMGGFEVAEIEVEHHARRFGQSKYGCERFLRGFSDMLTMGFLRRFRERPAHFVNGVAACYFVVALGCLLGGVVLGLGSLAGVTAILAGLIFCGMAGAVMVAGLLSELCLRGGLQLGWELPIVEDTAAAASDSAIRAAFDPVETGYAA